MVPYWAPLVRHHPMHFVKLFSIADDGFINMKCISSSNKWILFRLGITVRILHFWVKPKTCTTNSTKLRRNAELSYWSYEPCVSAKLIIRLTWKQKTPAELPVSLTDRWIWIASKDWRWTSTVNSQTSTQLKFTWTPPQRFQRKLISSRSA